MTEQRHAKAHAHVEPLVAVDVPELGAERAVGHDRIHQLLPRQPESGRQRCSEDAVDNRRLVVGIETGHADAEATGLLSGGRRNQLAAERELLMGARVGCQPAGNDQRLLLVLHSRGERRRRIRRVFAEYGL